MLAWILFALMILVAGRMADMEGRNPYLWGLGTGAAIVALTLGFGVYLIFSNVIGLVGVFVALWVANSYDDKKAGKSF